MTVWCRDSDEGDSIRKTAIRTVERGWTHASRVKGPISDEKWEVAPGSDNLKLTLRRAQWVIQKERSKRPKQRKCQHRANQANSRVWDLCTSSQHARMHSSVPSQTDDTYEAIRCFYRTVQDSNRCLDRLMLQMPEGSNEWGGNEGTITCCGDMKTPCPQPKSQELDLPLVDEAMRSLLEHPDMKMQAPERLQKSLSEPNLGHKDSQLPHPLRQTRRSARLPFQRRHMQAQAWRSSAEAFGQRQKSASLMDTRKQETMRTVHADCYRLCEQPDNQENRLMYQYLEQYAYVERKKRNFFTPHRVLPSNEGSKGVSPSDPVAQLDAGRAKVGERNPPADRASKQQGQKNTTAAQEPKGLPGHTLAGSRSSVASSRIVPKDEPFRPQSAKPEARPKHVAEQHRTQRSQTLSQLCRGCCVPRFLCRCIQRAWAKLKAASKALCSKIRKGSEKLSRKGNKPFTNNRSSEPTRLDASHHGSRQSLTPLAKMKTASPFLEGTKKDLVASEDKSFSGDSDVTAASKLTAASKVPGASKGSSHGGSSHRHSGMQSPVLSGTSVPVSLLQDVAACPAGGRFECWSQRDLEALREGDQNVLPPLHSADHQPEGLLCIDVPKDINRCHCRRKLTE